jgi:hypothetical protein
MPNPKHKTMETTNSLNIVQLKLRLIEQILATENMEILQVMLQFFVIEKTVVEKNIETESNENFGEKPFVVIRNYDKDSPYPKVELEEDEIIFKGLRNKQTKMYKNTEDLPNYDENLLQENQSVEFAKMLDSIGNLFDDEPPIEELLKMLTK